MQKKLVQYRKISKKKNFFINNLTEALLRNELSNIFTIFLFTNIIHLKKIFNLKEMININEIIKILYLQINFFCFFFLINFGNVKLK